jgi:hypothetical protein
MLSMRFNRNNGSSLASILLWLAPALVISFVLLFLHFRDSRMLVSRSPDGQVQITLWDRTDPFGDDLIVTVNRGTREEHLFKHVNDNCGPPRDGHVVWTPDSELAGIFLCDGLCSPTFVVYDRHTNRTDDSPEAMAKVTSTLSERYKPGLGDPLDRPWVWACSRETNRN